MNLLRRMLFVFLTACATFLFTSFTVVTEDPIDYLGIKGPLAFEKTKFDLAFSSNPRPNYFLQEYLPEGEDLAHFKQMLIVYLVISDTEPAKFVEAKQNELNTRKKTDALCNNSVSESPDGKEFILDFLVSETKEEKLSIVEFNAYRYKQVALNNGKKATLIYYYSTRVYQDEISPFLSNLKDKRTNYLNSMILSDIPVVKMKD